MNGLSDLDAVRPRKPRAPAGKGKSQPKVRSAFAAVRRLRSRATLAIASAGFSAIMVGILCNALLMQKGHHPAPLFAAPPASAAAKPRAEAPVPAAVPATAPAPTPAVVAEPVAPPAPAPAPARAAVPRHVAAMHPVHPAARPAREHDAIARLLGGNPAHKNEAPARTPAQASLPAGSEPLQLHKVRPGRVAARTGAPAASAPAVAD